jgi:hypothetical protein
VVLIQLKGGSARLPGKSDTRRLRAVAGIYNAKAVLLARWRKGAAPRFFTLQRTNKWAAADLDKVFR